MTKYCQEMTLFGGLLECTNSDTVITILRYYSSKNNSWLVQCMGCRGNLTIFFVYMDPMVVFGIDSDPNTGQSHIITCLLLKEISTPILLYDCNVIVESKFRIKYRSIKYTTRFNILSKEIIATNKN